VGGGGAVLEGGNVGSIAAGVFVEEQHFSQACKVRHSINKRQEACMLGPEHGGQCVF
jgi:hypothetical protein